MSAIPKSVQLKKAKKLKTKKCKYSQCKKDFVPVNGKHICCDWKCGVDYAKEKEAKRKTSEHRKAKKEISKAKREFRNHDKAQLRRDVQKIANRIGKLQRMIKGLDACVTCGRITKQMDGGHCYPTSTYSPIRYYVTQINPQCVVCNRWNGGMPNEYRQFMIDEHGIEKVLWLESHKGQIRAYSVEYLQKYKKIMSRKLKNMEKKYAM